MSDCKSGIYKIENKVNGKCYVGSAVDIRARWSTHKCQLAKKEHHSVKLQNAWNKYSSEAFEFSVIEYIPYKEQLLEREQFWLDELSAVQKGYNTVPLARNTLGYIHTEESIRKMCKPKREGTSETYRIAQLKLNMERQEAEVPHPSLGTKRTEDSRIKMSLAQKRANEERIINGGQHPLKGIPKPERLKAQAKATQLQINEDRKLLGIPHPSKGLKMSKEVIENNSVAQTKVNIKRRLAGIPHPIKGIKRSSDSRNKMSAAQCRYQQALKATGSQHFNKGIAKSPEAIAKGVATRAANKKAREESFVLMWAFKLAFDAPLLQVAQ